jgi:hypothetical protein
VALGTVLAACAPAAPPRSVAGAGGGRAAAEGAAPWEIPADALASQRLYRLRYDGPDGEGGFKVTLRLVAADRYQVQAADALGRPAWSLEVEGARGLWLDHRRALACRLAGRLDLAGLPLSPFPLPALPPLLLGRLPAAPAEPEARRAAGAPGATALAFVDAEGRRWTADLDGGRPVAWALWDGAGAAEGGRPRISWRSVGGEAILSDRERRAQLRWRQVVAEPLLGAPAPLAVPAGFQEMNCGSVD